MSARSTATIAADITSYLPANMRAAAPLVGGAAASFHLAETAAYALASYLQVGTADDVWLDLLAIGNGLRRQSGESDASLRERIRTVSDAVTAPAIKAAVDALLAAYGLGECEIREWFDGPYFDRNAWLDHNLVIQAPNYFVVVVPFSGTSMALSYLDRTAYLDRIAYLGAWDTSASSAVYPAIVALVNALRAAGVRWDLYILPSGAVLA